jgi:hypothetical protein
VVSAGGEMTVMGTINRDAAERKGKVFLGKSYAQGSQGKAEPLLPASCNTMRDEPFPQAGQTFSPRATLEG